MKKYIFYCILSCLFYNKNISAQSDFPDFGVYNSMEKELKECSFDKDADAVILFDYGFSTHDDSYRLLSSRRIRIKILNERGIENANIRIRYLSKDNFEFIGNIVAVSYTPDESGNFSLSNLDKKTIYTEKEDDYVSSIKFAIPNVKAGSIIEYKYDSNSKHYGALDNWYFQNEIPTLRSYYFLQVPPIYEFQYQVMKKRNYPITIKPIPDAGQVIFEMKNIPGLKSEPYMDAVKDYLQRVEFQFAGFMSRGGAKQEVNTTWRDLAYNLSTDKNLGAISKKDLSKLEEVKLIASKENSAADKISAIYNYVKTNFTCNINYGKFAPDGFKKILDKRVGSAGEINLLLVSLLQMNDIEAYPLLVADRDFGKVDTLYPFIDRFNKTAALAVADGKRFILDVSDRYCPAGTIPFSLLNTYAFIVDRKKFQLFQVKPNNHSYNYSVTIKGELNDKGQIKGTADISSYEYARQEIIAAIKSNEKKYITENIHSKNKDLLVDSFYYENADKENEPLLQNIRFNYDLNENAGFVLLNYNLFTGLQKSPFTKEERFTNVDFGCPFKFSVEATIKLPTGSKIDELPRNRKVETMQKNISVAREIKKEGDILTIKLNFVQTITLVAAESYTPLKNTYREIVEMLNEPIAIKLR